MPDSILFAAGAGPFAYLGVDPDPKHAVATLQPGCPYQIKLLAGWTLPPDQRRAAAYADLKESLAPHQVQGNWFWIDHPDAVEAIASAAKPIGGKRWNVRTAIPVRPASPPSHNQRRILTPEGDYDSAAEAGRAYGISRQAAWERATWHVDGWYWEGEDPNAPTPPRPPAIRRPRYSTGSSAG